MNRTFLNYQDIENMLARFVEPLRERQCETAVAILRGGLFPAHFLANELGLPMRFIQLDRDTGAVTMLGDVSGQRVLLVDDSCCTGRTMAPCKAWLEAPGCEVITCAIFAVRPLKVDFAVEAEPSPAQEWMVPWERRIYTPQARMLGDSGQYLPQDDWHLSFYAWDLDGIFVRDLTPAEYDADLQGALARRDELPTLDYVPKIDFRNAAIVTARPIEDTVRTRRWWARHFPGIPMHFRDGRQYGDSPEEVARYKADTALALGATHFVESDLHIATLIALRMPMLRVQWFDQKTHTAIAISAWETPQTSAPAESVSQASLAEASID